MVPAGDDPPQFPTKRIYGLGWGRRLHRAVAEGGLRMKKVSARLFLTLSVLPRCAYEMAGPVGAEGLAERGAARWVRDRCGAPPAARPLCAPPLRIRTLRRRKTLPPCFHAQPDEKRSIFCGVLISHASVMHSCSFILRIPHRSPISSPKLSSCRQRQYYGRGLHGKAL